MARDRSARILNVNPDKGSRDANTRLLRRHGFEVLEAGTGREALAAAAAGSPDLILAAEQLPDMSGREACVLIRADERFHRIPALHLTAAAVSGVEGAAGSDSDIFLTLPVPPEALLAVVRAYLRVQAAEWRAEAATQRWQRTFDGIGQAVCVLDREGRVRQVNEAMAALLERGREEIAGASFDTLVPDAAEPPEGWPFVRASRSLLCETSEVQAGERWFYVSAGPLFDEAGRFAGVVQSIRENTERRRLQRELEEERSLLEAVLHSMPAGVVIAEASNGRVILANERAGESGGKGFHKDGRPYKAEEWPLARSLKSGETVRDEEVVVERRDGSRVTMLVNSAAVHDQSGRIIAGVVTTHDLTERKQLEQQFRQAQKMEAIGRLAGGVSHDFNNLLTIIGGYGQMLLDRLNPKDPMRGDMEAIMEATQRATVLTRQLLAVSRRQMIQPRVIDLNRHVMRTSRMLRRVIGEDVELITALDSQGGRIRIDPGQLEQLLLNLAVNARDAMPNGGKLTVGTEDEEVAGDALSGPQNVPAGAYTVLTIRDTGCGMTAEVMSHLFEPFFTTKPKGKGTGLGLSMVYGMVKQSGGEVVVESAPGNGTAVRVYFPRLAEPVTEKRSEPARAVRGGTETILLVEDEAEIRRLACEMLSQQGYTVIEAGSGEEAIESFGRRGDIDLLLTDVVMPNISGRELADSLREMRPSLRVVFMSGYTDEAIAQHGIDKTGPEFVRKPFTVESLCRAIRTVLDRKES